MLGFVALLVSAAIAALATALVGPALLRHRRRLASWFETGAPWHDDVLRTAADDLGLRYLPRGFLQPPAAVGTVDGARLRLRLFPARIADQEVLELELRIDGLPKTVSCRRRANPATSTGRRTGDRQFDSGVVFLAPPTPGRTWLTASTRHALEAVVHAGGRVTSGTLRLEHAGPDLVGAAEMVDLVRQALRAARGLMREPVELREIVERDPDPRVRLLALGELLRDPATDRDWLRTLAAGEDVEAVYAANALGDLDRLVALVDGPAAREALLAVSHRITVADERIEAAFRRVLRASPDARLLQHAVRLCSVGLVVDLLAIGGPDQRAARAAVAAIQARALGERGGVSLADGASAGQLALADVREAGGVSLATPAGSPPGGHRANLPSREGS